MLKRKDNYEARHRFFVEALVRSTNHLNVINFYAIHAKTMHAYQLWWNGAILRGSWNTTITKTGLSIIGSLYEVSDFKSHKCFMTFRQTWVKLAWAFLCTMNTIQQSRTLHNDLSQGNIMLDFSPNNLSHVYIGACD